MKVLITGGCGFVGSHLARRLIGEEHSVNILDTFFTGHPRKLGDAYQSGLCAGFQGSVTNWDAVRRAMRGCHVVYHLAARQDWSDKPRHVGALTRTNVMGTAWVLTMARAMGVQKVIFASCAEVYGDVAPGVEYKLPHFSTLSPFGATKLAGEALCHAFNNWGLETVILRLFTVYGPGGRSLVEYFKDGGDVIHGDGSETRDFVHVSDVVNAMICSWQWDPGIYNVGTGVETTVMGLWRILWGDEQPTFAPPRRWDMYHSFADTERTESLWKPTRSIEELAKGDES